MGQVGYRDDVEVIVVDDGSSDDPKSVVARIGQGRIRFERNEQALGAVPNFNRCVELAHGELIHILHGDDLVLPGFYSAMDDAFERAPEVGGAFCRTQHIDGAGTPLATTRSYVRGGGVWHEAATQLASSNRIAAPSIVLRASTYEEVGKFNESLPHAADWDMWTRAAAGTGLYFADRVLAQYRVHQANDTSKRMVSGANMVERFNAMETILENYPLEQRPHLRRRGAAIAAVFASRMTIRQLKARNFKTAAVQGGWVFKSVGRAARSKGGTNSSK